MKIEIVDNNSKYNTLVRDSENRAIVESDKSKITEYETKRRMYMQAHENKIDIDSIKSEMSDIKILLQKLMEKY